MASRKKCVLVVNPISGDVDKAEIVQKTIDYADQFEVDVVIYETSGENDEQAIVEIFEEYKPERIIIAGGDGTIKMVGEALENKDVIFGILPAGSANGLSVDLNLPTTIEENLEIAFQDNFIEIDMICINQKKSLHLSDLGLNALLVKNYENGTTRGKLGYALQVITTLTELEEPFSATISANNETKECVARMIVIANSQKYGTGVTINPTGKMDDGKFEIVILKNLDLLVFGKIITGNIPVDSDDVEIITTDKAVIKTGTPTSFQIDGEYCGEETHLDIQILPNQMKITIPKPTT